MGRHEEKGQLDFGFKTPRRRRKPRLGRPKKPGAGVPHARRVVHPRYPLHVTLKMKRHVWQLRSRRCGRILERAFLAAAQLADARIAQYSVQHDHVHLLVEARDPMVLARALQGFAIRVAKGLNKLMDRRGAVFADRYHSRALRTPTEVRRALVYVLCNGRKHPPAVGVRPGSDWVDPYSSAAWFDGWARTARPPDVPPLVRPARTWLLGTGWRVLGLLRRDELPAT